VTFRNHNFWTLTLIYYYLGGCYVYILKYIFTCLWTDRNQCVVCSCFMCDFVCNSLCYMPRIVSSQLRFVVLVKRGRRRASKFLSTMETVYKLDISLQLAGNNQLSPAFFSSGSTCADFKRETGRTSQLS